MNEQMKLEITVYKPTGKFYSSCEVESPDIPYFKDEFVEFVRENLPAKYAGGYVVIRDLEDGYGFHNCLIKMEDLYIGK